MLSNTLTKVKTRALLGALTVATLCAVTGRAHAATSENPLGANFEFLVGIPGIDGSNTSFAEYINSLYLLSISLAALFAVIKIIAAGVKYMFTDIVTQKGAAIQDIRGALFGLLIIIAAALILNTINPTLTDTTVFEDTGPLTSVKGSAYTDAFSADPRQGFVLRTVMCEQQSGNRCAYDCSIARSACRGIPFATLRETNTSLTGLACDKQLIGCETPPVAGQLQKVGASSAAECTTKANNVAPGASHSYDADADAGEECTINPGRIACSGEEQCNTRESQCETRASNAGGVAAITPTPEDGAAQTGFLCTTYEAPGGGNVQECQPSQGAADAFGGGECREIESECDGESSIEEQNGKTYVYCSDEQS